MQIARPEEQKPKARKAEGEGWWFIGRQQWPPSHQLEGLGERCKLPQRGPRRSPRRSWFWCMLGLQKINSFCPQHTIDLSFLAANFNDFALVLDVTVFGQVGLKSQQSRWADHPPATPHYKSVNGYKNMERPHSSSLAIGMRSLSPNHPRHGGREGPGISFALANFCVSNV